MVDTDINTDSLFAVHFILCYKSPSTIIIVNIVVICTGENSVLIEACLCIRMKSTLAKRGVHIKSAGYRVVCQLTLFN